MKTRITTALYAIALLAIAFSCTKELDDYSREIRFSARSEVSRITKTCYSGVVNTSSEERIDWENTDLIRIFSDQVSAPAEHCSDYSITLASNSDKYSYATANPVSEHGLQWGDGSHTFYGLYPAPSTSGAQSGLNITTSGGNAVITAILPADQSFATTRTGANESYYGDMRLAYMAATTTASAGSDVTLSFTPIVTTFYVTVSNTTGATMTLKEIRLTSSSVAMTGTYKATVTPADVRSYEYYQGGSYVGALTRTADNCYVKATFPSGLSLAASANVTVALFALPQNIYNLTLTVTADETGPVSLRMTDTSDNDLAFTGVRKHNLNNIGVPPVSYELTVDKSLLEYDYTGVAGTAQDFTVTSTKTIGSSTRPAAWKTQIKNASDEWVDLDGNCPAWLANFPLNSTGVTTNSRLYEEDVTAQQVVSHKQMLQDGVVYTSGATLTPYDNSTEANAVDLSKYDFIHRKMESSRTTANTYIVSAPGWYKIPMMYGNIIENDNIVANSCKGSVWALGHLDYFKKSTDANIWLGVGYPWLQDSFLRSTRIHWEKYTDWVSGSASTTGRQWSSGSDMGVVDQVKLQQLAADTDGKYLYFHVDETNILPGNVLLAVYDGDGTGGEYGTCCWSWQIWITDQNMSLIGVDGLQVLPVNLGWIDDTEGQHYNERSNVLKFVSTEISNLETQEMTVIQPDFDRVSTSGWQTYYQWGRKDPLSPDVMAVYNDDGTINESIKHPSNIMYDESTSGSDEYYDWTSANYNNLWDSQNTAWDTPTSALPNHKTVYDPSPRGFSAPPDAAWDSFSTNGYEKFENGLFFYTSSAHDKTIFFPASGYINYNATTISDQNNSGYYWTIRPGQNVQRRASYCLRFNKSGSGTITVLPKSHDASSPFTTMSYRALAYSVRPVQYSVSYADSPSISGTTTSEIIFEDYEHSWGWDTQNAGTLAGGYYHQFNNTQSSPETRTVGDVTISVRNTTNYTTYSPAYYYNNDEKYLLLENNDELKVSVPGHEIFYITLFLSKVDGTPGNYATISASPVNPGIFTDGRGRKDENATWEVTSYTTSTLNPSTSMVTFTTASTGGNRKITGISVTYK